MSKDQQDASLPTEEFSRLLTSTTFNFGLDSSFLENSPEQLPTQERPADETHLSQRMRLNGTTPLKIRWVLLLLLLEVLLFLWIVLVLKYVFPLFSVSQRWRSVSQRGCCCYHRCNCFWWQLLRKVIPIFNMVFKKITITFFPFLFFPSQ